MAEVAYVLSPDGAKHLQGALDRGVTLFSIKAAEILLRTARYFDLPEEPEEKDLRRRVGHASTGQDKLVYVYRDWAQEVLFATGWVRPAPPPKPPALPPPSKQKLRPRHPSGHRMAPPPPAETHPARDRRQIRIDAIYRFHQLGMTFRQIAKVVRRSASQVAIVVRLEERRRQFLQASSGPLDPVHTMLDEVRRRGWPGIAHAWDALSALQQNSPPDEPPQATLPEEQNMSNASKTNTTKPLLATIAEAGRLLSQSRATLYRAIERGELELVKVGRASRITMASIEALVQNLPRGTGEIGGKPRTGKP